MSALMEELLPRRRISVHDYYRMAEIGVLAPDARVELIEGEIVDMPPIGSAHGGTVAFLARLFHLAVGNQAYVFCQSALRLSPYSEPQPDLILVRPRDDFYRTSHPTFEDALLVVEVSESSLPYDQRVKVPLYARHGIPEVWIIDLLNRRLHAFRSPADSVYQVASQTDSPGVLSPAALAGVKVDLSRIMG